MNKARKISNKSRKIKKDVPKGKGGFDYNRRIFTDIFQNKKSDVCILNTSLIWNSSLRSRIKLIKLIEDFKDFREKLHLRMKYYKSFIQSLQDIGVLECLIAYFQSLVQKIIK